MELTTKGTAAVSTIRGKHASLLPIYGVNTFDRIVFEHGKLPAAVILYALGKASGDDVDIMVEQGYAVRDK